MFWAAQAALAYVGIQRAEWSHSGLQASFVTELIRRRKRFPAIFVQHFNRILQLRLDADYRLKGVSHIQATRAVRLAEEFIAAITAEVTYGGHDPDIP
jgi:hypothetical protein